MVEWRVLDWSPDQRARVHAALDENPLESNRCAAAARGVLPVATELDDGAQALVIEPPGIYLLVRGLPVRWFHHVTVAATQHHVDALTGVDGHPVNTYLGAYFEYPAELELRPVEPDEWDHL